VDAVVFDLGGVLIDWNPRFLYRKLFNGDDARMERFLATVCTQPWNEQHDRGKLFSESIAELCTRNPEHDEMIHAYWARWPEMLNGPIHGSVEVLAELAGGDRGLFALTNWSAETFPIARARYEFLWWFDGIVVSGHEGVAKPDDEIFRLLLDRFGLTAASTLFIDDTMVNVNAARSLGLQALHFVSSKELRDELAARRLVRAAEPCGFRHSRRQIEQTAECG
jgi:2-haloacid dehalogenase